MTLVATCELDDNYGGLVWVSREEEDVSVMVWIFSDRI
jgi:hypothetical protein